jgi:tetratricopeptide (TPR) repeat protein
MAELPIIKIFLSSPGDVAEERALAEIVFRRLADEFADTVTLKLVIWEHEPVFGHANFQHQIERTKDCDLVVSILWSRLGTRLPSDFAPAADQAAPTGTEFEINDALAWHEVWGKPKLLIYRRVPGPQVGLGSADFAERSDQYQRLDEFCQRRFYADGVVVVSHRTFSDSHSFERYLSEHVRSWLSDQVHSRHPEGFRPLWRGQSPFRGLQPFEAAHQAIFFGRSEAVGDLIRRIRETEIAASNGPVERILLVQGMSGAGKTSLFKAGLLPFLELRPIDGIARWTTILVRPSESDPAIPNVGALGVLASRLCEAVPAIERLGTTRQKLAQTLFDRPEEAAAKIEICIAADADSAGVELHRVRLLIYIDQLEEAFALPDSSAVAGPLLAAMVALARLRSVWITATMRSDFVHRLEAYPDLMLCLGRSPPYTLMPPRPDELAEMIREPAKAAALIWEQRDGVSLDQELLREATGNPESLPLLEYTLAELYERREGRLLRWSDYGGGLRGALISAADEVVNGASGDVDVAFRDVMRELVGVGEDGAATRRYASLARFADGSAARGLLDRLVARRLCVTNDEGHGEGPVAYLAHEALIRSWPRAQQWLQRETTLLRLRDEVARDASVWEFHKRADDWLGVAPEKLAGIRQIEDAGLMPGGAAAEYASRSRQRAQRNRLIKQAAVAALFVMAVVAGAFWYFAVQQRDIATEQRNIAKQEAATADGTTQFMVSLFQTIDPNASQGKTVTVKEVLDIGAKALRSGNGGNNLQREPRTRAQLATAMGLSYSGLGLYPDAEILLKQALDDQKLTTMRPESILRTMVALGTALYLDGNDKAAEPVLREAVALAREKIDSANPLHSAALTALADEFVALKKLEEAKALCDEALVVDEKRGPDEAAVLANTLTSLSGVYFAAGKPAAAIEPSLRAIDLYSKAFGGHDTHTAMAMNDLGASLYEAGHYQEALKEDKDALPVYHALFGEDHPEISTLLNNIGRAELMIGDVDNAEPVLRDALRMTEKFTTGEKDPLVSPLNSLGMIDAYRGRMTQARHELELAESAARESESPFLDQVLLSEADLDLKKADTATASGRLSESKRLLKKGHPDDSDNAWRYAVWDAVNAEFLARTGKSTDAAHALAAAQPLIIQRFGESGFYSLLAKRRAQLIANTSKR